MNFLVLVECRLVTVQSEGREGGREKCSWQSLKMANQKLEEANGWVHAKICVAFFNNNYHIHNVSLIKLLESQQYVITQH